MSGALYIISKCNDRFRTLICPFLPWLYQDLRITFPVPKVSLWYPLLCILIIFARNARVRFACVYLQKDTVQNLLSSAFFFQFIYCIYQLRHPDGSLLLLLLLLPFQVSRQVQLLQRGIPIYSYRHAFEATPLPFIKNTATSKNEDNFIVSDFTSNPPYIVFVIIHGCIQLKSNIKIFLYWSITTKTRIIICRRNASSLIS